MTAVTAKQRALYFYIVKAIGRDAAYAVLEEVTGKTSTKELDQSEMTKVINELIRKTGLQPDRKTKSGDHKRTRHWGTAEFCEPSEAQKEYLARLIFEVFPGETTAAKLWLFEGFCRKNFGIVHPVTLKETQKVITALKGWKAQRAKQAARERRKQKEN